MTVTACLMTNTMLTCVHPFSRLFSNIGHAEGALTLPKDESSNLCETWRTDPTLAFWLRVAAYPRGYSGTGRDASQRLVPPFQF